MARVTVEDCLEVLDTNRFDLTMLAAKRARQIFNGYKPMVDPDKDKPTVIALREIAEGLMSEEIYQQIEAASSIAEEMKEVTEQEPESA